MSPTRTGERPLVAVPRRAHRAGATDARVRAAAAVLAGEDVDAVAERHDVDVAQLLHWAEGLQAGGAATVGGVGLDRPTTGPWSTSVPVEDYLAVVMHELRTPLTAARAGLGVLTRDDLPPAVRSQVGSSVLARLAVLERLCGDVLDTVAVATGRVVLEPERLDLAQLVREVCGLARVAFPARLPVVVDADPRRTVQAVTNLLAHVGRYAAPDETAVHLQVVGGVALLTVRAQGLALRPEDAARMLEPFTSAAEGDGNGLALYVVRTLVVAAGGQVGVAGSAPEDAGDATVFWLTLPLAP